MGYKPVRKTALLQELILTFGFCMTNSFSLAILGAVAREVDALLPLFDDAKRHDLHGAPIWTGLYKGRRLIVGAAGFNKVNAAITTSALLEQFAIAEVWCIGCAGAYNEGPLRVGDVLVSERMICGDEGVLTERGILSCAETGIPILTRGADNWYDEIPVDSEVLRRARDRTPSGERTGRAELQSAIVPDKPDSAHNPAREFHVFFGASLTVGMASGDASVAKERFRRYGAFAENMEGSAIAQACFRFQTPMIECRGVSNMAGDRRKERWEMDKAIANSHAVIFDWL